ncbi:MAG TPA: nicotinamide riboside transporter PnuC [Sphingobacteriaceae bacterium]|nr:nicotinamide riboside transporter PnuC [Sphingobacteriaceae bacterium]
MYICNVIILFTTFWQQIVIQFQQTSWLEWIGTISGFLCVYLAAKEHILNWPVAIISVIAYALLFFEYQLYGDSVLQLYFLGTSIYGWYYWMKNKQGTHTPVIILEKKEIAFTILSVIVLSIVMGLFLDHYTDTNVPYADGFCTSMSLVAQFLMTRKILQNWILWIIVDVCYVPLYLYKNLYLTSVLYALFLVLAIMGYISWKKTAKEIIL